MTKIEPVPPAPRASLRRPLAAPESKRAGEDIAAVTADGRFSGYASLFGVEDLSHDIVERGAFLASLARRGPSGVKMLYQHDPADPIGRWLDIRETAKGLHVVGQLMTELARGREVLALLQAGVLDGLSIGFRTVKGRKDARTGIRRLAEVDLWEISVVTFPMQPGAKVGAKSAALRPPALSPQTDDADARLAAKLRSGAVRLAALRSPHCLRRHHDRAFD